uniref:Alpha-1,3-mannosyl-glycoprotein 2-beta-N-acetylglucosaminyltransferase n=1 Tax=Mesocestoides corti TaxID=53468 RepID=A0A5K3FL46_MESCO
MFLQSLLLLFIYQRAKNKLVNTQSEVFHHFTRQNLLNFSLQSNLTTYMYDVPKIIPVLMLACDRIGINRSLSRLIEYRRKYPDGPQRFPIYVSQDCNDENVLALLKLYDEQITVLNQPDHSEIVLQHHNVNFQGYYRIARNYKWSLSQVLDERNYELVIVMEDDLDVAPDFFDYFYAFVLLLLSDRSLYCISAWNDNGRPTLIDKSRTDLLYRSDFFPGLGWMLTRRLWQEELRDSWPAAFWDDFMRTKEVRRGRACIRPEVSRTYTFGRSGVSNGQFYDTYLRFNYLNDKPTVLNSTHLYYNLQPSVYDSRFLSDVYDKSVLLRNPAQLLRLPSTLPQSVEFRLEYHTQQDFVSAAQLIGAMHDFKSGIPRTAYKGVVSVFYRGRRIYLAPSGVRGWANNEYPNWE